jgi:hypothetical protein
VRARRIYWLALALTLFAFSALLMSWSGDAKPPAPRVKMPDHMDRDAYDRLRRRRTLPAPAEDQAAAAERPRLTDPLLRALPPHVKKGALVIEANALRYSPVGQLLIACIDGERDGGLSALKDKLGFDPLTDLDRVSVADGTLLFTGQFGGAKWTEIFEHTTPVALNDHTTLWEPRGLGKVAATWNNQMVILGQDRDAIEAVVGRLEGTAPPEPPLIDDNESYGEAYGVIAPGEMADLLGRQQADLADRLRQVVTGISLHVDASHDVGIVLDASGPGQDTGDFGKAVGSALVLGRVAALAKGDKDLGQVLDYARVAPAGDGKSFRTELALPLAFFEDKLRDCAAKGRRDRDAR